MNDMMREMGNVARGTMTLGDRTFKLRELNWNDYCEIEDEFGKDPSEWRGVKASRFILWLGLRKEDPSLTPERIGELATADDFRRAADAVDALLGRQGEDAAKKR